MAITQAVKDLFAGPHFTPVPIAVDEVLRKQLGLSQPKIEMNVLKDGSNKVVFTVKFQRLDYHGEVRENSDPVIVCREYERTHSGQFDHNFMASLVSDVLRGIQLVRKEEKLRKNGRVWDRGQCNPEVFVNRVPAFEIITPELILKRMGSAKVVSNKTPVYWVECLLKCLARPHSANGLPQSQNKHGGVTVNHLCNATLLERKNYEGGAYVRYITTHNGLILLDHYAERSDVIKRHIAAYLTEEERKEKIVQWTLEEL
jgi:hypothetical protein